MSSPHIESTRVRRLVRWLLPTALFGLAPKCLLCTAAYVGIGAALGIGGPELCGAPPGAMRAGGAWLAWGAGMLGGLAWRVRHSWRRRPVNFR